MRRILRSQELRRVIMVLVGAILLYAIVRIFNVYGLRTFLRSYWNYRNGIPHAWTDLFFEVSLLAEVLVAIALGGLLMAHGLTPQLVVRLRLGVGLMVCLALTLVLSLFTVAASVLKSIYYHVPIGWSAFLMRSFTGMLILNTVFLGLGLMPAITSILRPEIRSNPLLGAIFNLIVVLWALAYATFVWFTRYSPLPLIFFYGIVSCVLGVTVLLKGVSFYNVLCDKPNRVNNQEQANKEGHHPSLWTIISGVVVLLAGVWIVITGIVFVSYRA